MTEYNEISEDINEHSISRGLSGKGVDGQVLENEGDISVTQQGAAVSGDDPEWGTGLSSERDRAERTEEDGRTDDGVSETVPGTAEVGAHQVDSSYEQPRGNGGGDSAARDDLRLSTSDIPIGVIDSVLRDGTDRDTGKIRIIFDFMVDKPEERHVKFVRDEYGTGGKGLIIDGQEVSVWFNRDGMRIAYGRTVHSDDAPAVNLTWEQVSGRIHELLEAGEYATRQEIKDAKENALRDAASIPVNIALFFKKDPAVKAFDGIVPAEGKYQDKVEAVMERLSDSDFCTSVVDAIVRFNEETRNSRYVVYYEWYKPIKAISEFSRLTMETEPFDAAPGKGYESPQMFISDDEADYFLCSGHTESKYEVYLFFSQNSKIGTRAADLKLRFGIEESKNTLSGYSHFGYSSDGSGLVLSKTGNGLSACMRKFSWIEVAERVSILMDQKKFFSKEEFAGLTEYERDYIAGMIVKFYAYMPGYIKRPFDGVNTDILRGRISFVLTDGVESRRLYSKMQHDMSILLMDADIIDPWSDERVIILLKFKSYIDGDYTIFEPDRFASGREVRPIEENEAQVAEVGETQAIVENSPVDEEIHTVSERKNFAITDMDQGESYPDKAAAQEKKVAEQPSLLGKLREAQKVAEERGSQGKERKKEGMTVHRL